MAGLRFSGEVLVCEDNEIGCQVISKHLSRTGLNVTIAENGKSGVDMAIIRIINGNPYDLILMDIYMPEMDGLAASRKLMEIGSKTPVIALTADTGRKERETYLAAGMSDCLKKPFSASEMQACLLKYFDPVEPMAGVVGEREPDGDSAASGSSSRESVIIDRELGIELSAGDEELYNRILASFAGDNRHTFVKLSKALDSGDVTLAHQMTHTLKNLAAMLGASKLAEAALSVEKSLSGGKAEVTGTQMNTLENRLNAVLEAAANP